MPDMARIMDKLMVGLGLGDGYIAQGGDLGSIVARILGSTAPGCRGNSIFIPNVIRNESIVYLHVNSPRRFAKPFTVR